MNIDFIGVGAQKSGTSWVYACLYEHPEICAPIKEIHFFSRPRFEKGKAWYESHFDRCDAGKKKGEFSTSYLYSKEAPERIKSLYPQAKIIAILRNPVTRAYSQYRNALKAGEITEAVSFADYQKNEASVVEQGRYAEQLERYFSLFSKEQIFVTIFEDIDIDKRAFMERIYTFIGVDSSFVPSMLDKTVNVGRIPRRVFIERCMHHIAEFLRKIGFDRLVWRIRKLGIPDLIRSYNTRSTPAVVTPPYDHKVLATLFREDAQKLSQFCGRDMVKEWDL